MAQCFCTVEKCQELEQRIEALEALLANHLSQDIPAAHGYRPNVNVGISGGISGNNLLINSSVSVDGSGDNASTSITLPTIDDVNVGLDITNQGNITVRVSVEGATGEASGQLPINDLPVNVDVSAAYDSGSCDLSIFTRVDVGNNSSNDRATVNVACKGQDLTLPPINPPITDNNPPFPNFPPIDFPPLPPINPPNFGGGGSGGGGAGNGFEPPDFGGSVQVEVLPIPESCRAEIKVTSIINGKVSSSSALLDLNQILSWDFSVTLNENETNESSTLVSFLRICSDFIQWEIPLMANCDLTPVIDLVNNLNLEMNNNFTIVNTRLDVLLQQNNDEFNSLEITLQNQFNNTNALLANINANLTANFTALLAFLNVEVVAKLQLTLDNTIGIDITVEQIKEDIKLDTGSIYKGICKEMQVNEEGVYSYERTNENSNLSSFGVAFNLLSQQIEELHKSLCESLNISAVDVQGEFQQWKCELKEGESKADVGYALNPIPDVNYKFKNLKEVFQAIYSTMISVWVDVCESKPPKVPLPQFIPLFKCMVNEEGNKELIPLSLNELQSLSVYQRYQSYLNEIPNPNNIDPETGKPKVVSLTYPSSYANWLYSSIIGEALNYNISSDFAEICKLEVDNSCQVLVDDKSVYAAYGLYLSLYWQWDDKTIKTGIHQTPLRNPIQEIVDSNDAKQTWDTYFSNIERKVGNQWALLWTEDENGNGYKLPWCQGWFESKTEAKRYFESIVTLTTEIPRSTNNPSYSDKDNKQTNIVNAGKRQTLRKVCLIRKTPNSNEVIVIKSFSKPK